MGRDPDFSLVQPKHLRTGLDLSKSDMGGLARLLIAKGVFTEQEYNEAITNAAKFAGSERVDLYAEVDGGRAEVFVRDRGVGFDPEAVPEDRRGVRESILRRMERHGGNASVRSEPGQGTEVELTLERGRGERGVVSMSPVGSA